MTDPAPPFHQRFRLEFEQRARATLAKLQASLEEDNAQRVKGLFTPQAKRLRTALQQEHGLNITHTATLHLVARLHGFDAYRTMIAHEKERLNDPYAAVKRTAAEIRRTPGPFLYDLYFPNDRSMLTWVNGLGEDIGSTFRPIYFDRTKHRRALPSGGGDARAYLITLAELCFPPAADQPLSSFDPNAAAREHLQWAAKFAAKAVKKSAVLETYLEWIGKVWEDEDAVGLLTDLVVGPGDTDDEEMFRFLSLESVEEPEPKRRRTASGLTMHAWLLRVARHRSGLQGVQLLVNTESRGYVVVRDHELPEDALADTVRIDV